VRLSRLSRKVFISQDLRCATNIWNHSHGRIRNPLEHLDSMRYGLLILCVPNVLNKWSPLNRSRIRKQRLNLARDPTLCTFKTGVFCTSFDCQPQLSAERSFIFPYEVFRIYQTLYLFVCSCVLCQAFAEIVKKSLCNVSVIESTETICAVKGGSCRYQGCSKVEGNCVWCRWNIVVSFAYFSMLYIKVCI